jgi:hypothetical protein
MAYANINSWLKAESGRIGPDIYSKTLNTSPWLKLVVQDTWPDEMGSTINTLLYSRSLPEGTNTTNNKPTWAAIAANSSAATGGNCNPATATINFYNKTSSYNLDQTALESPPICVNDLRFSFRRKDQLSNIFRILTENTSWAWQTRYRDEYLRISTNKLLANSSLTPGTGGNFAAAAPTSRLSQPMLDKVRMTLIRDGAGNEPLGRENGTPVFGLICSSETSYDLIHNMAGDRDDYRYSTKANDLLAPLGVERTYKGFYHLIDDFMPRYTFNGSTYTEVTPYIKSNDEFIINPAYENAQYEVTVVFHKDVYHSVIPAPISSPGGSTSFDPVSYRGDFKWLNIRDRDTNPDGTIGFFRGVLSAGSKPIRPEWGYAIMHLRCGSSLLPGSLVYCS